MHRALPTLLLSCFLLWSSRSDAQTGKLPLPDLGTGIYKGFSGGLYLGGSNTPPPAHLANALAEAAQVVPRDAAGLPSANGRIGLVSIGMSNTTHEFAHFERLVDRDPERSTHVYVLTASQGGQDASITANPNSSYWTTVMNRVTAAGLTPAQVQVAWLKNAHQGPANNFPVHAQALQADLETTARNLRTKFPNLRLCYMSSRTYGGYASAWEPQAYETGFSVRWAIEKQIGGAANLNWNPAQGAVVAPLLLWGPYLWADGPTPSLNGQTWLSTDSESDGVHPSAAGERKVALLLRSFFATDATTQSWYVSHAPSIGYAVASSDDATISAASPAQNFGAANTLETSGGAAALSTYLRFDLSAVETPILAAKLSLRVPTNAQGGAATLRLVSNTNWSQSTLTFANAPAAGSPLASHPGCSRDGTVSYDVTAAVLADADDIVSFALTATGGTGVLMSAESGQGPRLVLTLASTPDATPYGCDTGVQGSLRPLGGAPALGTTFTLGADDPSGTSALGSLALLALATAPSAGFPCGLAIPGWGLGALAPSGELLLSIAPPNPFQLSIGGAWTGPAVPFALSVPQSAGLVGVHVYAQAALVDFAAAGGAKIGLTEGSDLELVPGPLSNGGLP